MNVASNIQLNRRRFLRFAAAIGAAAYGRFRPRETQAQSFKPGIASAVVYVFDPSGESGEISDSGMAPCAGCGACRKHAEHKRFATYAAADARRAHAHCRCAIRTETVTSKEYDEFFGGFGSNDRRDEYDVRWGAR
jgi:hypothetical protein